MRQAISVKRNGEDRSMLDRDSNEDDDDILHVHDLPQLYAKPSAQSLLATLELLSSAPSSFSLRNARRSKSHALVSEAGVPRYLTSIVSSSLSWIASTDDRDAIYAAASSRLAERAGRSALPDVTRMFEVVSDVEISLHEPSLTEDNLGLKTWTSSLLLAKQLTSLRAFVPTLDGNNGPKLRVLELGAGTGLVGIAAACLWKADVMLTDLPEIVPNLERNINQNAALIQSFCGDAAVRALDWSDASQIPTAEAEMYPVIMAADPIYSPEHPKMLVETVTRWLDRTNQARFIIELPLRDAYNQEREDLRSRLRDEGLQIEEEGEEIGYDDWHGKDGDLIEVKCWWSVWKRNRGLPQCRYEEEVIEVLA